MRLFALAAAWICVAGAAFAQERHPDGAAGAQGHSSHAAPPPACAEAKPACAATADPMFDRRGDLWLAFSVADKVYVARSRDLGKSFAPSVLAANASGGVIDANGEARPKVVEAKDGSLLVAYTTRPEKSYNGAVFTTRSSNAGESFAPPTQLIEGSGQRFDIYGLSPNGKLYAAWLDKRNADKAKAEGRDFAGSGVAVAWSNDNGASFEGKSILMDHSCECCRVAMAFDRDRSPVFAWRHAFDGNLRDHYVGKLSKDGSRLVGGRVSEDEWATSCPHHGPSLAVDARGVYHIVWFSRGKARQGLFYSQSADGGKSFSAPEKFGDDAMAPSHAFVLAQKRDVYRVWKEFDGTTTTLMLQHSRDGGRRFDRARVAAQTKDASDHPLLIARPGAVFLSWLTRAEGYRLLNLSELEAARKRAEAQ